MLARLLQEAGDSEGAGKEYMAVQKVAGMREPYANIGLANLDYERSTQVRSDKAKQEERMKRAMKMYMETLEIDPCNVYATLGLANIMAEHQKVSDAVKIYQAIKDNFPMMPHAYIN